MSFKTLSSYNFKGKKVLLRTDINSDVKEGTDKWFIKEKRVKLVNYPIMFPKALGFMTRVVPCELVMPGRAEPLDWEDPSKGIMSSKELEAVLDPVWLRGFVLGVAQEAGGKGDKQLRMFVMLAMALSAICMILLFVVMVRLNSTNATLLYIENLIKVSGK